MMKVRRYMAQDASEAFRLVRSDLGPDALILQTERVKRGGLLGLFRREGVEVLAVGDVEQGWPELGKNGHDRSGYDDGIAGIRATLDELQQTVERMSHRSADIPVIPLPPGVTTMYRRLVDQGMSGSLAQQVLAEACGELSRTALADAEFLRDAVVRHLQGLISECGPISTGGGQSRVVFLIGPTGVGKTTTLAKLAADFAVLQNRRVTLITADTFRIGGVGQLQTYADIIEVPMAVAYGPDDLASQIESCSGSDLILVDTPGRSQHDVGHLDELGAFLRSVDNPQVYLALSASTRLPDMLDIVSNFGVVPLKGLVATKLDETTQYGPIVELAYRTGKPLAYVTTGQNVPDDIEVASARKLSKLVLTPWARAA